jgi:protein TBF1
MINVVLGQHMGIPGHNNGYGSQYSTGAVPYHTQSAPTQVLYEQARQAAVAKASPHSRRPGLPSQRRPWSTEEENALMAGLDQVKGPHWSQILALYGAKGQVSEILKDRNQVQLKDKARNLKLFFLKSNIEVPYYLQCVTGELKTRAPSQAARKEAEERARLVGDEEQARFNGIMALANGMQQPQSTHPPSNHSGTSRENSQESLHVTDETIKAEPESEAEAAVSFESSLGTRLHEDMDGHEMPAKASVTS